MSTVLEKLEFEPRTMTQAALGEFVHSEYVRWGSLVKATGYAPEN